MTAVLTLASNPLKGSGCLASNHVALPAGLSACSPCTAGGDDCGLCGVPCRPRRPPSDRTPPSSLVLCRAALRPVLPPRVVPLRCFGAFAIPSWIAPACACGVAVRPDNSCRDPWSSEWVLVWVRRRATSIKVADFYESAACVLIDPLIRTSSCHATCKVLILDAVQKPSECRSAVNLAVFQNPHLLLFVSVLLYRNHCFGQYSRHHHCRHDHCFRYRCHPHCCCSSSCYHDL